MRHGLTKCRNVKNIHPRDYRTYTAQSTSILGASVACSALIASLGSISSLAFGRWRQMKRYPALSSLRACRIGNRKRSDRPWALDSSLDDWVRRRSGLLFPCALTHRFALSSHECVPGASCRPLQHTRRRRSSTGRRRWGWHVRNASPASLQKHSLPLHYNNNCTNVLADLCPLSTIEIKDYRHLCGTLASRSRQEAALSILCCA